MEFFNEVPQEIINKIKEYYEDVDLNSPTLVTKDDGSSLQQSDLAECYERLDMTRAEIKSANSILQLLVLMQSAKKISEARQRFLIKKIAEFEANAKPIVVDTQGTSTLPTFDADSLTLDGLNKE
jgi:archaellum component FlaC